MQLFKVTFAEFNNISSESLHSEILPISVTASSMLFVSSLINIFGFVIVIIIVSLLLL
jgi:hypothetical protein